MVREGYLVHGYDGWGICLQERPLYKVVGEQVVETIVDRIILNEKARKVIYAIEKYLDPDSVGMTEFKIINNRLFRWLYPSPRVHYPVHEAWVQENFPDLCDDFLWRDRPKDPDWGTKCPACGYGRVNDDPEKWIARMGHCFRCEVAKKITYQNPMD